MADQLHKSHKLHKLHKLQRVGPEVTTDDLAAILDRDGAAIVEGALHNGQVNQINTEFDDVVASTAPGLRNPSSEKYVEFYGVNTVRLDGLAARSKAFWEVLQLPLMLNLADKLLLPNCEHYLLNTGQLIEIGPSEKAQHLHRDEDAWPFFKDPKPQLEVEAMFALTDFTLANGATQVVPGSHRWSADRKPMPSEVARAEMSAGSALVYLGSTLHGGGPNTTANEWRRGMFLGFVLGWLRTEENCYLSVPMEAVKEMPRRCQELLGYKSHGAIGVVDVGNPMVLLNP